MQNFTYKEELKFFNNGVETNAITAGLTKIQGQVKKYTKVQFAQILGFVDKISLNAKNQKGNDVFEVQGNEWRPQGLVGDYFLEDINNPVDRWFVKPDLFEWEKVDRERNVWTKNGKEFFGIEIPKGTIINTLEGEYITKEGDILTFLSEEKADYYCIGSNLTKPV